MFEAVLQFEIALHRNFVSNQRSVDDRSELGLVDPEERQRRHLIIVNSEMRSIPMVIDPIPVV